MPKRSRPMNEAKKLPVSYLATFSTNVLHTKCKIEVESSTTTADSVGDSIAPLQTSLIQSRLAFTSAVANGPPAAPEPTSSGNNGSRAVSQPVYSDSTAQYNMNNHSGDVEQPSWIIRRRHLGSTSMYGMAMDDFDEQDQLPSVDRIMKCNSKHNLDIERSRDNEAAIPPTHQLGSKAAPIVLDSSDEDEETQDPMK